MKESRARNHKRLAILLAAKLIRASVTVQIVPLEVLPEPVLKKAIILHSSRRAKGLKKSPKKLAGRPIRVLD